MFSHTDIWSAIDRLAHAYSTSPSGLAKQAGLDPTTFNKSKRITANGRLRWPSTESLSKTLTILNLNLSDFAAFVSDQPTQSSIIPMIGLKQAGSDGVFDEAGRPIMGASWGEIRLLDVRDPNLYALEIGGESLRPILRQGDHILVAPNDPIRRGDRIVIKTKSGEVIVKELLKMTKTTLELISLNPDFENSTLRRDDLGWVARILWISQ